MKKRLIAAFIAIAILLMLPGAASADAPLIREVPIALSFTDATGIDLNLRLDPNFVETAELVSPAAVLADATYVGHPNGAKMKVAISSATPLNHEGELFKLRLTLKKDAGKDAELCKLLQVMINEQITWQAADCLLISGVKDGGVYIDIVNVGFNEGSALLDGAPYTAFAPIEAEGEHTIAFTDLNGKNRTVSFKIERMPEILTGAHTISNGVILLEDFNITPAELRAGFDRPYFCVVEGNAVENGTKVRWIYEGTVYHELTVRLLGDADNSGMLEVVDVTLILRQLIGLEVSLDSTTADLNLDGRVSIADAVNILRKLNA